MDIKPRLQEQLIEAVLGIEPEFFEPMDDDVLIDEYRLCTGSDMDSDSDTKDDEQSSECGVVILGIVICLGAK
ncbi:hypothetical protein H5410_005692 [Solanum commersonii]|uniref:Uncharacterized protein n=1 Tax=Solanum commersonii TaxID=4109 RepID=A0A9J6A834_SOLCO|nr:hypothetical protein H5410_005692 [Solanum commersonii]